MRIPSLVISVLTLLLIAAGCDTEGTDSSNPTTQAETPATERMACTPSAVGDSARAIDMRVDEVCYISPLSLKRIDGNTYEMGLNCTITASKDATHTAMVRLAPEGYVVSMTEDEHARVTDSIDCEGDGGGDTVTVFLTVNH